MIGEILGILVDSIFGSRCHICGERHHNDALHRYIDHADVEPHTEPSRFTAEWPTPYGVMGGAGDDPDVVQP